MSSERVCSGPTCLLCFNPCASFCRPPKLVSLDGRRPRPASGAFLGLPEKRGHAISVAIDSLSSGTRRPSRESDDNCEHYLEGPVKDRYLLPGEDSLAVR